MWVVEKLSNPCQMVLSALIHIIDASLVGIIVLFALRGEFPGLIYQCIPGIIHVILESVAEFAKSLNNILTEVRESLMRLSSKLYEGKLRIITNIGNSLRRIFGPFDCILKCDENVPIVYNFAGDYLRHNLDQWMHQLRL